MNKTDDSVIQTVTGEIFQIHHIVTCGDVCYIYGKIWVIGRNDLNERNESPIAPHLFKVIKKNLRIVFSMSMKFPGRLLLWI